MKEMLNSGAPNMVSKPMSMMCNFVSHGTIIKKVYIIDVHPTNI
jgi:hypothetical protein